MHQPQGPRRSNELFTMTRKAQFLLSTGSGLGAHLCQLQLAFGLCLNLKLEFDGVYGIGSRTGEVERKLFEPMSLKHPETLELEHLITIDDSLIDAEAINLPICNETHVFVFRGWSHCKGLLKTLQEKGLYQSDILSRLDAGKMFKQHVNDTAREAFASQDMASLTETSYDWQNTCVVHLRLGDTIVIQINSETVIESWKETEPNNSLGFSPSASSISSPTRYPLVDLLINEVESFALLMRLKRSDVRLVMLTDGLDNGFSRIERAINQKLIEIDNLDYITAKEKYSAMLCKLSTIFDYCVIGEGADETLKSIYFLTHASTIIRTHGSFADRVSSLLRQNKSYRIKTILDKGSNASVFNGLYSAHRSSS